MIRPVYPMAYMQHANVYNIIYNIYLFKSNKTIIYTPEITKIDLGIDYWVYCRIKRDE